MAGTIEVLVPGGQANPGPPLGPELGPTPVDVQAVVQQINDETEAFDGTEVPVTIEYEDDGVRIIGSPVEIKDAGDFLAMNGVSFA